MWTPSTVIFFAVNYALSLRRLQELDDGALFLAGDVGTDTHVMNDYIPLCVTIHCRRPDVVAAQTIVRPKLFTAELHAGITRGRTARLGGRFPVCLWSGQPIPADADENEQDQSCEVAAVDCCNHIISSLRNPWRLEEVGRFYCARPPDCPTHTRLSLQCWGLASN